jgi:hypothetical protein
VDRQPKEATNNDFMRDSDRLEWQTLVKGGFRMRTGREVFALFVFVVLLAIFMMHGTALCAEEPPAAVKEAAVKGLTSLLPAIVGDSLKHYNFSDPKELDKATLGGPFRVYTITPENILSYSSGVPVERIISPTSVWLFPVIAEGEVRTLLTVDQVDGGWKAVAIGSSGLAKQWASIMQVRPSSEGYDHTFVRVFQATSDIVLVSRLGETEIIPLESARVSLGLVQGGTFSVQDIIISMQKPVLDNLNSSPPTNGKR